VGTALLIASGISNASFVSGEVILYLVYKAVRNDFIWFPRTRGKVESLTMGFYARIVTKLIVDYR